MLLSILRTTLSPCKGYRNMYVCVFYIKYSFSTMLFSVNNAEEECVTKSQTYHNLYYEVRSNRYVMCLLSAYFQILANSPF